MWAHQHTQQEAQHKMNVGNNATVKWFYEHLDACFGWLLSKEKIGGKGIIVEIVWMVPG